MMNETEFADIAILPRSLWRTRVDDTRERRELLVARCGPRLVAVFADEADHVTAWKKPTPLPRAPKGVLGVVSVRGRISTVLDPLSLLNERSAAQDGSSFAFIITLRSDEQLALAVERAERIIEIFTDDIEPLGSSSGEGVVLGILQMEGKLVAVLNIRQLFTAALRGMERRRRRS